MPRLVVVGLGIQVGGHLTALSDAEIRGAEKVVFLAADEIGAAWVRELNPEAESLHRFYRANGPRSDAYERMVKYVLELLSEGREICFAVYGHPGVFADPTHEAVRRARAAGVEAVMLPAISAEDCLFSDLGLDPGRQGCQSYEATDFLLRPRNFDPATPLVLWQVGVIGNLQSVGGPSDEGLRALKDVLIRNYGGGHEAIVYEAATLSIAAPTIVRIALRDLAAPVVTRLCTLFVPPKEEPAVDRAMVRRLGLGATLAGEPKPIPV